MSLRARLRKLEDENANEPQALIFITHYEDRNGEIESTNLRAIIDFGGGRSLTIRQHQDEREDAFETRLTRLKLMDFETAETEIARQHVPETVA